MTRRKQMEVHILVFGLDPTASKVIVVTKGLKHVHWSSSHDNGSAISRAWSSVWRAHLRQWAHLEWLKVSQRKGYLEVFPTPSPSLELLQTLNPFFLKSLWHFWKKAQKSHLDYTFVSYQHPKEQRSEKTLNPKDRKSWNEKKVWQNQENLLFLQVGRMEENGMEKLQEGESYIYCWKIPFSHLDSEE